MLCKLSLKNIKKSIKDYAIYFFTLILGVSIFYIFNALDSQTIMLNVSSSTHEIIKLMNEMLSAVSIFVSIILGFLIIYASRFLIKRRNKEFGIYLTLGMSKRKISLILFFENLFIGIISLAVGCFIGIFLSQFMSILVANMFEADLTNFRFVFSYQAFIKTIIYFGIMYFLVMIFNTISISKCKLIDLLQNAKKSEQIHMKNPILCTIIFLASTIALSYAYYLVTAGVDTLQNVKQILIPIVLGCISTFFIFWSLSGLLILIITRLKKTYYKGLNSFTLRQISSKINTTVFSMTIICLMLFVTICVLSSALSIKNSMTANLKTLAPIDIEIEKRRNLTIEEVENSWNLTPYMIEDSNFSLNDTLNHFDFPKKDILKDIIEFDTYSTENITIKDTLGSYYEEAKIKYPYMRFDTKEELIKISDYNKAAELLGLEKFSIQENEYILISDYENTISLRNEGLKRNTPISILKKDYYPKYQECQNGYINIANNHINMGVFIVPDDAVDNTLIHSSMLLANYKEEEKEKKKDIETKVLEIENHPYNKNSSIIITTKLSLYEASVGLGALVTFIGLYLGIIFLISSAAILALKELSESSDNKNRFKMLRKLGADEKMIHKALFHQIAIFFLFPLILAMIHSIFGIMFCSYILETLGKEKLLQSIVMTAIFLVIIYGGYFLITYYCSKNIIKEK